MVYKLDNGTRGADHLVILVCTTQAYILDTDHSLALTGITLAFILGIDHSVALTGSMPTYPILYSLSRLTWAQLS